MNGDKNDKFDSVPPGMVFFFGEMDANIKVIKESLARMESRHESDLMALKAELERELAEERRLREQAVETVHARIEKRGNRTIAVASIVATIAAGLFSGVAVLVLQ